MTARHHAIALLLGLTVLAWAGPSASAHPSYAIPQTVLDFGNGRTATLELLYGDGLFFADPARAQLRTGDGATVAKTPIAGHIATFCPTTKFCWAFLSNWFLEPWRLHPDGIAWNTPPEANPYFPDLDETSPVGFAADWTPWAITLGLAVLIYRHALSLAATLLPLVLIVGFTRWFRATERRRLGRARYSIAVSILLWLLLIPYEFAALYFIAMLRGFPLLPLLLALAFSLMGANKFVAWLVHTNSTASNPAPGAA